MSELLTRTALYDEHLACGARMVDFAGWEMPVQYNDGIIAEHVHTRTKASIFDICHMGEFRVIGQSAAEELDAIFARPVKDQKPGTCRYNFLLNEAGGVIDDLIVYRISDCEFYIVVNASTRPADFKKISSMLSKYCTIADESDQTAKIDLQGPLAAKALSLLEPKLDGYPSYYSWIKCKIMEVPCLLSRTGYTGELGFELYFDASSAREIWRALLAIEFVKPAGLGARDTLRLEMGYPLYGHELDENTTPIEAGFAKILRLELKRKFSGSEKLSERSQAKWLVGIELDGRRAARIGAEVFDGNRKVGQICSGAFAPSLTKAVALAYVNNETLSKPGTELEMRAEKMSVKGKVVPLPFYKLGTARALIFLEEL